MSKEIGSFIGLDLRNSGEFYDGDANVTRLNSARAGIYHSCRLYGCKSVHIPYYLCPTVKQFLLDHSIKVHAYFINEKFEPVGLTQKKDEAVLLVNYFGMISAERMSIMKERYTNVIIDNSAAFFSGPLDGCYNVYSTRKFFGVPDGCYVIGEEAVKYVDEYKQDFSSSTASFLFSRQEYTTSETYAERMKNEERIDNSGILQMSGLTRSLLNSIDYLPIMRKRLANFHYANTLFDNANKIKPAGFTDAKSIPMVYPLVVEDELMTEKLKGKKIFTGRLWNAVLQEVPAYSFEAYLSKYLVPIPVDQRYTKEDLDYIYSIMF